MLARRYDAAHATLAIPHSFDQLVVKNAKANALYKKLDNSNRYAIAFRMSTAVGDDRKLEVMQKIIKKLESGEKLH